MLSRITLFLLIPLLVSCGKSKSTTTSKETKSITETIYRNMISAEDQFYNQFNQDSALDNIFFHDKKFDSSLNEAYRFTWHGAFHQPFRIEIQEAKNSYQMSIKFKSMDSMQCLNKEIKEKEWIEFKSLLNDAYFWRLGCENVLDPNEISYFDGSTWKLEGFRKNIRNSNKKYHCVWMDNPKAGPFKNACNYLITLSDTIQIQQMY